MESRKDLAQSAKKKYGQNFLKNSAYINKIIQAMPNDGLRIVEIGPGLGDLTKELVRARYVTAFEIDTRLCEHLNATLESSIHEKRLELRCGDALEQWSEASLLDEPYHLVANLPYYIATNLILKALHDPQCNSMLVMVQKEVAVKFSAGVGEREFSALAVLAETAGKAEICFEVEPEAFVPPPKVTSAVLSIHKDRSLDDEGFETFLKSAFAQPRKKLAKNLMTHYPKGEVAQAFASFDIGSDIRPHEAETSIYHHLYNYLKDHRDGREKTTKRSKRRTASRQEKKT